MAGIYSQRSYREAEAQIDQKNFDQAFPHLWAMLSQAHMSSENTDGVIRLVQRAGYGAERLRAAGAASLFLGDHDYAKKCAAGYPTDLGWIAKASGDQLLAARYFEDAGWYGHAAWELHDAGDHKRSRLLWERLANERRLADEPYVLGLVFYNLSRACTLAGDAAAARRAMVMSIHQLEQAADMYEIAGARERAFDCFQVVMALGKEGAFENLAQGYLGSIRILSEDQLRHYVIQYYEDFQEIAIEREEFYAAATLYRESASYARANGLPYETHYRRAAGLAHIQAARSLFEKGASAEMVENAYVAAIDCFNVLGQWSQIGEVYGQLALLDLSAKRRQRYQRLQQRVAGLSDRDVRFVAVPAHLRVDVPYPDVWRSDVLEWEQGGDPAETMMALALDPGLPEFTRRRARLVVLYQRVSAPGEILKSNIPSAMWIQLAGYLGDVEAWGALSPLENMLNHEDHQIRISCMLAVRRLYFKRSFSLISRGLEDVDAAVRAQAVEAVLALHFPHAFEPLSRIYRHARAAEVLEAALRSIGRIESEAAVEFLVEVLREAPTKLKELAAELLVRSDAPGITDIVGREIAFETGKVRDILKGVLARR